VFVIIDIDGLLQAIKLQSGATTDRPIETDSRVQATSVAIDRIHIQPVLYGSSKVEEGKLAAPINLQNQSLNKSIMTCIINVEFCKIAVFTHWGVLGPSCRLPTASPGRWIGGRPPDMVASCDLSG